MRRSRARANRPGGIAVGLACALLAGCSTSEVVVSEPAGRVERPNILLLVADDLGYSDLGVYGSEIETPHLDALANAGVLATDFYVAPRGAPTQAMLLTGCDNHAAGFGGRLGLGPEAEPPPGYEGTLSPRVVTVASLLREAGYRTVMAGKWELGSGPRNRPAARGFERSFALHDAAASYWSDMASAVPGHDRALYTRDGEEVEALPDDWFSTRSFTDFVLESIEAGRASGRPFFAYVAYQAPHGPLGVPEAWRDRYAGRYDEGYDAIRRARLLRMKQRNLVATDVRPYPGLPTIPAWSDLDDERKRSQARRMELYAAAVANLDFHVGRLLAHLRETGELEGTLVVFLSDNGAEPASRGPTSLDPRNREWYAARFPEHELEQWGGPGSFVEYGPGWAQVSTVPFRMFKGTLAEGGVRVPLIVSGPGVAARGSGRLERARATHAILHVSDLAPTFLELAGVERPEAWRGRALARLKGRSLTGVLEGRFRDRHGPHDWLGFALAGDRAVRREEWKVVWMRRPYGIGDWRLYRLDRDPSELHDRSADAPEEKAELLALWEEYVGMYDIVVPDGDAAQKSMPTAR